VRHSLRAEAAAVLAVYAGYEATRGFVAGDADVAVRHAREVATLEESLHVFVEGRIQDGAHAVPGLLPTFGVAYLTLHLAATAVFLLWLHRRRPAAYPLVRTTLLVASALAVVGFVLFPTAPPRLAGIDVADTISGAHVNLNKGLVSSVYNPFAAIPSLHIGYAVVVGAGLLRYAGHGVVRVAGALYPPLVLLVIVATGNHFFVDAASGAAVVGVAFAAALLLEPSRIAASPATPSRTSRTSRTAPSSSASRPTSRRGSGDARSAPRSSGSATSVTHLTSDRSSATRTQSKRRSTSCSAAAHG